MNPVKELAEKVLSGLGTDGYLIQSAVAADKLARIVLLQQEFIESVSYGLYQDSDIDSYVNTLTSRSTTVLKEANELARVGK